MSWISFRFPTTLKATARSFAIVVSAEMVAFFLSSLHHSTDKPAVWSSDAKTNRFKAKSI